MRLAPMLAGLVLLASAGSTATIYVPDNYATIQDAISASVNGDTIVVRPGTYVENIDFLGKAVTVRSEQGCAATIIDGNQADSVVTFAGGETTASVLEGFTVTNGTGSLIGAYPDGGGIYCFGASPTIRGNVITGNTATYYSGGGIACYNSSLIIEGNVITGNTTSYGGGVACYDSPFPIIRGNTITGNGAAASGGGIYCSFTYPIIEKNLIAENVSASGGGGIYFLRSGRSIAGNSVARNATPAWGGGICCDNSSPDITGNLIAGNKVDAWGGGGIYCTKSSPAITNCTITGNTAGTDGGGGVYCYYKSSPVIANTILWGNAALVGPEIWVGHQGFPSSPTIRNSDVMGGQSSCHVEPGSSLNWGAGMIDADPRFVSPSEGDYHISWRSPCRDSGDNSAVSESCDREGDPRIAMGTVDVGADEFYCHLYHVGDVLPGTSVRMTVLGAPGYDASIAMGWKLKETPCSTPHGYLWLSYPFKQVWALGSIPGSGVLSWDGAVPSAWLPGGQYPFQALVGPWGGGTSRLTNVHVLEAK